MLKDQLLAEANEKIAGVAVELDGIFESVELSEEAKTSFSTVFEQVVKAKAVELAESHITSIAEAADAKVAELVEAKTTEINIKLTEDADKYLTHLGKEWLAENKLAVENGIKANMLESMVLGMKALFVEHHVEVPADAVDVVAELEDDLQESKDEIRSLFDRNVELEAQVGELKKDATLKEATADLTDTQKEKVMGLVEGLSYNDTYQTKLGAIVEMVVASTKTTTEETTLNINESVEDEGANFKPETVEAKQSPEDAMMAQYAAVAKRYAKI